MRLTQLAKQLTAVGLAVLIGPELHAQPQPPSPQFEVISVKPRSESTLPRFPACHGDRFEERGMPLLYLMRWAYQLTAPRIQGLPAWTDDKDSRYDIEAKAAAPVSDAQCRAMVQSSLANRFNMTTHREQKEMRVYALTVGRKGTKMREATPDTKSGVIINGEPFRTLSEPEPSKGISMERFATFLSSVPAIGLPVVDRTGLQDAYTFNLTFTLKEDDDRPSIWVAVPEQLGLRLEPIKARIDVLVVDHIEKPHPH
jgi:uncharacterized protein (TIGR03435 family)